MDYLVNVNGNVISKQAKTYVISANSKNEALEIASKNFEQEYESISSSSSVTTYHRTTKAIIAFVFMFIAILLSCVGWKDGHETISIAPDDVSCLYGVLLYSAFIVRFKGIERMTSSWIDIVACLGVILLLSAFINTLLQNTTVSFFGQKEIPINMQIILPVSIILSWVGLKLISAICMAFVGITALVNISSLNVAMGSFLGTVYMLSSFLGIIFYLSIEPVMVESLSLIKNSVSKGICYTRSDLIKVKSSLTRLTSQTNNEDKRNQEDKNEKNN